jgi:hypothetical protein
MNFYVDPAKIDAYQLLLTDLAGQTGPARDYVHTHLHLSLQQKGMAGQGLWALAISRIGEASDAVNANLERLHTLSTASAAELARTATMYRNTDRANAERLDRTY